MKLTVAIHTFTPQCEPEHAGDLVWDGETITASDPERVLLKNIAVTPIRWPGLAEPISPTTEPEKFIRNLWMAYRSPYLTAMKAVEG